MDYVNEHYTKDAYIRVYNNVVQAIPGEQQWEKSDMPAHDPPAFVTQPGRPKKLRRRSTGEAKGNTSKRKRSDKPNKCSHCGVEGYTKRKCTNPPKDPTPPRVNVAKDGRSKNPNTINVSRHTYKKRRSENSLHVPPAFLNTPRTTLAVQAQQSINSAPPPMETSQHHPNVDDLLSSLPEHELDMLGTPEFTAFLSSEEIPQPLFTCSTPTGEKLVPTSSTKRKVRSKGQPPQDIRKKTYYP